MNDSALKFSGVLRLIDSPRPVSANWRSKAIIWRFDRPQQREMLHTLLCSQEG